MEYKNDIRSVVSKNRLTFNELIDIIVRCYGTESEDETMVMTGDQVTSYLKKILDNDSYTIAVAHNNSEQLQDIFTWYYDVEKGDGYLQEKSSRG